MNRVLATAAVVLLAGCSAQVALISPSGTVSQLTAKTSDRSIAGDVDGTPFSGTIITNESVGVGVGQSFSGSTSSTGIGTTVMSGNSGRAMLFAKNGESIQCQFNYQSGAALGECQRSNGVTYLMTTHPPK